MCMRCGTTTRSDSAGTERRPRGRAHSPRNALTHDDFPEPPRPTIMSEWPGRTVNERLVTMASPLGVTTSAACSGEPLFPPAAPDAHRLARSAGTWHLVRTHQAANGTGPTHATILTRLGRCRLASFELTAVHGGRGVELSDHPALSAPVAPARVCMRCSRND